MKKVISFLTVLCIMVPLCMPVADAVVSDEENVVATFTFNEYDALIQDMGSQYSQVSLNESTIEQLILDRANLSTNQLRLMGYSTDQIEILKNYDGSPLVENPQLRGVFANLSGEITKVLANEKEIYVLFAWEWDKNPILSSQAITDQIGIAYNATNSNSQPMNVKTTTSVAYVRYYKDARLLDTVSYHPQVVEPNHFSKLSFPCGANFQLPDSYYTGFAKTGTLNLIFSPEAPNNPIYSVSVAIGYCHFAHDTGITLNVNAGIFGLGFNFSGNEMYYGVVTFYADGRVVKH